MKMELGVKLNGTTTMDIGKCMKYFYRKKVQYKLFMDKNMRIQHHGGKISCLFLFSDNEITNYEVHSCRYCKNCRTEYHISSEKETPWYLFLYLTRIWMLYCRQ
jgi:hypothetical protein